MKCKKMIRNWRLITEHEFSIRMHEILKDEEAIKCACVTGPGRSGAIASVYASHILGIPFFPYGCFPPESLGRLLIVDTASESGKTIRKAHKRYKDFNPAVWIGYQEPPRVYFWYESGKPQRYKHERS